MRKASKKTLIKQIDTLVTKILILREGKCVVCGSTEKLGTGHIFSRRHLNTRFDIEPRGNCHVQCWPCNFKHSSYSTYPYNNWYIKKFGDKQFANLYERWNTVSHAKAFQLEILRDEYKKILEDLNERSR